MMVHSAMRKKGGGVATPPDTPLRSLDSKVSFAESSSSGAEKKKKGGEKRDQAAWWFKDVLGYDRVGCRWRAGICRAREGKKKKGEKKGKRPIVRGGNHHTPAWAAPLTSQQPGSEAREKKGGKKREREEECRGVDTPS